MERVNLYVKTTFKGPRRKDGAFIYLLEAEGQNGTVTKDETWIAIQTTENTANLDALKRALERIKRPVSLCIWLDCPYVAGALKNHWPEAWEKTEWTTAKGKPVKDAEKWQSVLVLTRDHEVTVKLGEHHAYARWMEDKLKKVEVAPVQREGEWNG